MLRLRSTAIFLVALAGTISGEDEAVRATTVDYTPTGKLSQFRGFATPRPTGEIPPNANFMYASVWAGWSAWSFCVNGHRIRVRACNTVKGFSCLGTNKEMEPCAARAPNMNTHRKRVHSDYDVIDPYEADRREAMNQLYPDYDANAAAQQKKPAEKNANFVKLDGGFAARAAGVQASSKLDAEGEWKGREDLFRREMAVLKVYDLKKNYEKEDNPQSRLVDSMSSLEGAVRRVHPNVAKPVNMKKTRKRIVGRVEDSNSHVSFGKVNAVSPFLHDRLDESFPKDISRTVKVRPMDRSDAPEYCKAARTETAGYERTKASGRLLKPKMMLGRSDVGHQKKLRQVPFAKLPYEKAEEPDKDLDVTTRSAHPNLVLVEGKNASKVDTKDENRQAKESLGNQSLISNQHEDGNRRRSHHKQQTKGKKQAWKPEPTTLNFDWTENPDYDQELLRNLQTTAVLS